MTDTYGVPGEVDSKGQVKGVSVVPRPYLASDVLRAGINAPDMVQSSLYGVAREEYEKLYFMIQDDISRLQNSRYR